MTPIVSGPSTARFLLVGEAPGEMEVQHGKPFVGHSGQELDRMLTEAGLDRAAFRVTNVIHIRPPKNDISAFMPQTAKEAKARGAHLVNNAWVMPEMIEGLQLLDAEIRSMPNLEHIFAAGNTPLWALRSHREIMKWRGSQTFCDRYERNIPITPIIHPAAILRQWGLRWITVLDLKRAKRWQGECYRLPDYRFITRPTFADVCDTLRRLESMLTSADPRRLAIDIETRMGHVVCVGVAWSDLDCICIPFIESTGSYWSVDEEIEITLRLRRLMMHPNVELGFQNGLYDRQYFARHWGTRIPMHIDTMIQQHICFPGIPKGLDFISSQHNGFHCYWKDESKEWAPHLGEEQLWIYNCKDGVATWEASHHLDNCIQAFGFQRQLAEQMEDAENAFTAMLRGIRYDFAFAKELATNHKLELDTGSIATDMKELCRFIEAVVGIAVNPGSPKQVHQLCYDVFQLKPIRKPGNKNLTADKDAIAEWLQNCDALVKPILNAIEDYRSLSVYRGTFALAPVDTDGRFRCSIRVAGPNTFRWSTAEDAFGFGTNMQNLPTTGTKSTPLKFKAMG